MPKPRATFKVTGTIKDFTRADNLYRTMKRESGKLLEGWTIEFNIDYVEREGELEIPE
jgi:hypothetical protein